MEMEKSRESCGTQKENESDPEETRERIKKKVKSVFVTAEIGRISQGSI